MAVFVALLIIVDWLMSNSQRKTLTDGALVVWNWLDDNRSIDFVRKFKDRKAQVNLSAALQVFITSAFVVLALVDWAFGLEGGGSHVRWMAIGQVVAAPIVIWVLNPWLLNWITAGESPFSYLLRSTISVAPIIGVATAFHKEIGIIVDGGARYGIGVEILTPATSCLIGAFMVTASVLLYFWYINIALIIGAALSYLILGAGRVVLERSLENPKGLVLGLSALVAALGVLVKAFLGHN